MSGLNAVKVKIFLKLIFYVSKILFLGSSIKTLKNQEIVEISLEKFSTRIPRDIGVHFIEISNLIIHNSDLNRIQRNDFVSMSQLTKLQLYENQIETVDFDSFHDLSNLEYLDLDRNNIFRLHDELLIMSKNFRVFLAAHNNIEEIPLNFFNSTKGVRKINLRSNKIQNFDFIANISHNFENLAYINLRNNSEERCDKFYSVEDKIEDLFQTNRIDYEDLSNDLFINIQQCAREKVELSNTLIHTLNYEMESTTLDLETFKRKDEDEYNVDD